MRPPPLEDTSSSRPFVFTQNLKTTKRQKIDMTKNVIFVSLLLLAMPLAMLAQLPYQDTTLSAHERAVDLCGRLTLEEKASLMLDDSPAIPRLGIKRFNWWSEALHGVANQGDVTVFPEPIGMAASFNDALVYKVFDATSDEMRAKWNELQKRGGDVTRFHALSVWTPNVNIFRDPRWGRGQETYGEDPYLTSRMGCAAVRGLQGPESAKYRKLWACAKHYAIHSGPEWARHTDNITDVSPRDLWETYMPAFKSLVQDARVREVMCAYQRWDDEPCCGNARLLQQILRDEWGFKYLVVSDCGAVTDFWESHKVSSNAKNAATKAALAGTDVECGYNYVYRSVPEAVKYGALTEQDVDKHVIRLLEGRFDLGEMDDNKLVPWSSIPTSVLCSEAHRQLSLAMSLQTMTLLQNNDHVLPLDKKAKKIAVIGPNMDNEPMMWGNYNGTPRQTITILDGVKRRLGKNKVVSFKGCDLVNDQTLDSYYGQCSMDGKTGFRGTFWNNRECEGKPTAVTQEKTPVQVTTYGQHAFAPGVNLVGFSAKYETVFRPKQTDRVLLDVNGCGFYEVYLDGVRKAKVSSWRTTESRVEFDAVKGREYKIEIRYHEMPNWNADLKVEIGHENPIDYQAAIQRLKDCETVVFVGGIAPQLEGEEMPVEKPGFKGGDRTNIELPQVQRGFLKALKETGKKVVLVNCSGSAIALAPETQTCDAILQAWYPGQEGGEAVARVLFGEYNPSGKLPVTFYKSSEQLPDFKDYSMKGRTYRYMDDALFPFGYGLSYTSFQVGEASLSSDTLMQGAQITLKVPVSNVGKKDGTEVVQVYVKDPSDVDGPLKTLKAFQRVDVKAGQTAVATITLDSKNFELFDVGSNTMRTKAGTYEVYYGNCSADKDLKKLRVTYTL